MESVTPIKATTEPTVDWQATAKAAEEQNKYLQERIGDLEINLEIANERWVKTINDLAATELELRKLKRNSN